jgi:ankyrin repeat protein
MKYSIALFILITSCNGLISQKTNAIHTTDIYSGDYKELMDAAAKEDLEDVKKIYTDKQLQLNFADKKFGVSLLNWCIINNKLESFNTLLELGADPNWQDSLCNFAPPIVKSAQKDNTTKFFEVAIQYGGNLNIRSGNISGQINGIQSQTPLLAAISSKNLDNVKLAVEKGADINAKYDKLPTPLAVSLIYRYTAIAKYLLDKGADYKDMNSVTMNGKKQSIFDLLDLVNLTNGSKPMLIKEEIIGFLKTKNWQRDSVH